MAYSLDLKIQSVRQIAQEKLQSILYSIPDNKKNLVIEPSLIKPLEYVCGASWLKSNGINKIYKFDRENIPTRNQSLVFLISCNLELFNEILNQIQTIEKNQPNTSIELADLKHYHIIVCPTLLHIFHQTLEEEGLFGLIELHRFNWDFLFLDTDLLSLEIPQLFRELFIKSDTSLLSAVANSLRIFNMIFKRPSLILSYGVYSDKILDMVDRMEGFVKLGSEAVNPDFTAMIVIDRNKDYPSCLLTPVVYSGLLLEVFHSNAGYLHIDVPNNRIRSHKLDFLRANENTDTLKKDITKLRLSSAVDTIYQDNRYKHISDVVSLLSAQAKVLGMEDKNLKDMKLTDMQEYVAKKLPKVIEQKRDLFKHLILCEAIVNELGGQFEKLHQMEELMLCNKNKKQTYARILENLSVDAHKYNAVRHITLLYLTCGLTQDEATGFITSYLNAFGYKYMPIFPILANAKLFPTIENAQRSNILSNITIPKWTNQFQMEANKLKLLPSDQNRCDTTSSSINDASTSSSYVFNGTYIPLAAQLAKILLDCKKFEEFSAKLGNIDNLKMNRYFDRQNESFKSIGNDIKIGQTTDLFPMKVKTIFIFIVGGVTYAEVAACNLVGRLCGAKIVLASNCVLSGEDIIKAAFD